MVTDDTLFDTREGETLAVIKRGELQSGDLLVLCHPGHLTNAGYGRLIEACERVIGAGVKVLLLEDGIGIEAILSRGE